MTQLRSALSRNFAKVLFGYVTLRKPSAASCAFASTRYDQASRKAGAEMVEDKHLSKVTIDAPDPNRLNDPQHWRDRADEARAMADTMSDREAREKMLTVAAGYDRLAELAQGRLTPN